MLPPNNPDRIRIVFDDHRLVANAGLLLSATLAQHLGLRELVDHHLDLGGAPGRANTGDKMLTLVASALAGGDCIDDADALRAGGTVSVLAMVGAIHPGHLPAQLSLGAFRHSTEPPVAGGHGPLGPDPATRPSTWTRPSARLMDWPSTPAREGITRCWPLTGQHRPRRRPLPP